MLAYVLWRAARLIVQYGFSLFGYFDEAFAAVCGSQAIEKLLVRL